MTECRTPELQDLLPDFVAESLSETDRMRVTAHLASCETCAGDLAVLQQVRAARPAPSVHVDAIVAALPRPTRRPALQLHGGPPTGRATAPARPAEHASRGGASRLAVWRWAAAIGVVLAGATSVMVANRGLHTFEPAAGSTVEPSLGPAPLTATPASDSLATTSPAPVVPSESVASANPRSTGAANVTVSYGALDDASEAELQLLLDRLEQWDGATSAEPAPTSPVVSTKGGITP